MLYQLTITLIIHFFDHRIMTIIIIFGSDQRFVIFFIYSICSDKTQNTHTKNQLKKFNKLQYLHHSLPHIKMKKHSEEMQTLCAGCSKVEPKISPRRRPPSRGVGWPKFNQLEMATTFTCKHSLVRINARKFELLW